MLSVDVDAELVSAARRNLTAAGYQDRVKMLLANGATVLATADSLDRGLGSNGQRDTGLTWGEGS